MKDEYIIVNKTALIKTIKQLEESKFLSGTSFLDGEIEAFKKILQESALLLPEIEKALEAGRKLSVDGFEEEDEKDYKKFISQLKLPI